MSIHQQTTTTPVKTEGNSIVSNSGVPGENDTTQLSLLGRVSTQLGRFWKACLRLPKNFLEALSGIASAIFTMLGLKHSKPPSDGKSTEAEKIKAAEGAEETKEKGGKKHKDTTSIVALGTRSHDPLKNKEAETKKKAEAQAQAQAQEKERTGEGK
jgi:hypothetical protein